MNSRQQIPTAEYTVCVEGAVDRVLERCLHGLTLQGIRRSGDRPASVLHGPVHDELALMHALTILYDTGYTILWVERGAGRSARHALD